MAASIPKASEPQARAEMAGRNTKLGVLVTLLAFRTLVAYFVVVRGPTPYCRALPGRPFAKYT